MERLLTLDRRHTLAGRENITWFFANRKWVRAQLAVVECAWAKRPVPQDETAIRFLLLAPKRSYKRAHDRNKIKRWLRAAVAEVELFSPIEEKVASEREQLLIMMRIAKPLADVEWNVILSDIRAVAQQLMKRV